MLIKKDQTTIASYFEDSSSLKGGHAEAVYFPENEKEAVEALKEASSKKIPLTLSGNGTGTTGGRIPFGGIVLATDKFNKIKALDRKNSSMIVESGVTLEEIQKAAQAEGFFYAPDPTEQTAFVGASMSTNASGSRSFTFGSTRDHVQRLKVILSNGEILNLTRSKIRDPRFNIPLPTYKMPAVKNAAGYYSMPNMDLIDLFIGSEGTLGFIIEAELSLIKKEKSIIGLAAFFKEELNACKFANEAKPLKPLSVEFFNANSLELLRKKHSKIPAYAKGAILFEDLFNPGEEETILEKWIGLLEKHGVEQDDVWMNESSDVTKSFKEFRHDMPELINEVIAQSGFRKISTDMAVPDDKALEMYHFYNEQIAKSKLYSVIFGHISQNHLHVNLVPKTRQEFDQAMNIYLGFARKAISLGGTVSAEHGIGKLKKPYLLEMYGEKAIRQMVEIKKKLDPGCILGLDNIFGKELL